MTKPSLHLAAASVAMLALSGCAVPATAPAATTAASAPNPSSTPSGAVTDVIVRGDRLTVKLSDGNIDIPFSTDAAAAVTRVTALVGEQPTVDSFEADQCTAATTESSWGALHIFSPAANWAGGTPKFSVMADGKSTVGGIPITLPSLQSFGTPESEVWSANPTNPHHVEGEISVMYFDVAGGGDGSATDAFGGYAVAQQGQLVAISAPAKYHYNC